MKLSEVSEAFQNLDSRTRTRLGVLLAALLLIIIGLSTVNARITALEKKRRARETDLTELMKLRQRFREASAGSQRVSNRLQAVRPDDSPAKVIEEIGIKGRNSQVKPVKGADLPGFVEDAAEVKLEGLSANEATNLIYRLEKGTRPITVKKAAIKQRFEDPSKLDVTLTIALIKPAPAGAK
ncbi:type II secretion system protein GspM [Geomonas silvestris]|uniref:Type II secretion system protein GspM n=1 Tax=Geomonas silvestris TaxID=2740184 RepID=A0A6V8MIQ0_9BACT|nr:general secretion pathway protein GspM [Geomonas silvestris]GFO59817.1 type II secretion system protein GspM [Geomonas silvestris]